MATEFFGVSSAKSGMAHSDKSESIHRSLVADIARFPNTIGFEPKAYLRRNPDVAASGGDPLEHFVRHGLYEGRGASFFYYDQWHNEMNEVGDSIETLRHVVGSRSDAKRPKVAFFGYAWNSARRPDAYMRECVNALANLGANVDVYIAGMFADEEGATGFRADLKRSDLGAFVRHQSYDFAISFNNSLIIPEVVNALNCRVVSIIVDSVHHLIDHEQKGRYYSFGLPIHAAPIYSSFLNEIQGHLGRGASASFLPAATVTQAGNADDQQDQIAISWVASMLGDHNLDSLIARVDEEVPDGLDLVSRCLTDIEKTGGISQDPKSQKAVDILCEWAHWDYHLLEMHLQEIVTNGTRVKIVERLSPLGLKVYGNARWRAALSLSPDVVRSFRSGAKLRSHADLRSIYDSSKISINMPQVHAGTGMQYRILDILASKALLITKHVPGSDMETLFGAGSPIVTFTDLEDLERKCVYYLSNEDERLARVKACNALVARNYSFSDRMLQYLELSNPKAGKRLNRVGGRGSMSLIVPDRVSHWTSSGRRVDLKGTVKLLGRIIRLRPR